MTQRPLNASVAGNGAPARRLRLVYFINLFPHLVEAMIYREVNALRARGYEVETVSIRRPDPQMVPPAARHLAERTRYLLPVPWTRLLWRHATALARFRGRYVAALHAVLTGTHERPRDRLRSLCHFAEAVIVLPEIEALRPDGVHAHWAVGAATCAMVIARLLDLPFTFTAHAYDIWRERLLLPEKLQAADCTVTCTEHNRDHLIARYGAVPARVRAVHHGLPLDGFVPPARNGTAVPVILTIGRLVPQKGFEHLLDACAALAAADVPFRCEVVGDGPLRAALEQQRTARGLAGRVTFLGQLDHDAVVARYATADIFALLCVPAPDDDRDGIPNVLIEAMAMALPCVSTRFSGVPELVVDGETGLLVEAGDAAGAARALAALLHDPARRQRLGAAGRRRVAEGFTIEVAVDRLAAVFEDARAAHYAGREVRA